MRASAPKTPTRRLYILGGLLFLWIGAICFRLVRLQVVKHDEFVQRALRQQNRSIPVEPRRGNIYDRNGYALAMSVDVDSVFAVPSEIHDPGTTAALLAKVLDLDPQEITARLQASRNFAFIKRKIDQDTANRIRELNLRGIYFRKEPKRFYPKRELAAQVLGYVGMDDEGLGGLEREFDDDLRGIPGQDLISVDARRKWFSRVERPPDPGQNLVLTIDQTIQYIAEKELDRGNGGGRKPAHRRNSGAGKPSHFQSQRLQQRASRVVEESRRQRCLRTGFSFQNRHVLCGDQRARCDAGRPRRLSTWRHRCFRHEDPRS